MHDARSAKMKRGALMSVLPPGQKMNHPTKQRLLETGLSMLLAHGYNDLGIQAVLTATGTPKGSFYHHFRDKEDFALQVIDEYMSHVHAGLEACLTDHTRPPLARVRHFFELTQQKYQQEGYLGCLLGGIGQELSGVSPLFRERIDGCLSAISKRIAVALEEAKGDGSVGREVDSESFATLLVNCWEGAALRSRLRGDAAPLVAMLDFYFAAAFGRHVEPPAKAASRRTLSRGRRASANRPA